MVLWMKENDKKLCDNNRNLKTSCSISFITYMEHDQTSQFLCYVKEYKKENLCCRSVRLPFSVLHVNPTKYTEAPSFCKFVSLKNKKMQFFDFRSTSRCCYYYLHIV